MTMQRSSFLATPLAADSPSTEVAGRWDSAFSLPPISRPADLAERVAGALRVAIVGGELAAGERLVPERIGATLGVSRPPVITALRRLEREGLVAIGTNGRPRVVGLTPEYVRDLYGFRLLLDHAVVAPALGRVPLPAEAQLREITAAMVARAEQGALEPFAELDLAFHGAFLALAGNRFLLAAWQGIGDVAHALLVVTDRLFPVLPQLAAHHQDILDSLCSGDQAAALAALRRHYDIGEQLLSTPMVNAAPERTMP